MEEKEASCIYGGRKIAILFSVGILFILAGCTCYPLLDSLIQNKINSQLVLSPTSTSFKQWQSPDTPIYLQFFMFSVENPDEVKKGEKPFVSQKGPYSYKEHRFKENITWLDDNYTVSYNERQWFVFDPTTSCNSCNPYTDTITAINIPLITLANVIKNIPDTFDWKDLLVNSLLLFFKDKLFQKKTVHDLLWGYPDPLLEEYRKLRTKFPFKFFKLPVVNPVIALQQNNTYQGVTTIHTGASDINKIEKWTEWDGRTEVGVWDTTYANMINGSDGTQFPPQQNSDSVPYVFVTQLCRSLYLTYERKSKVKEIDTLKFIVPEELFLNATLNPNNAAFCTKKCYPTGILDISVCQKSPISLPIFISAPHFYFGDKSLVENVNGLSPNKQEHETFLEIESHLGVPLSSAKRLQINIYIEEVQHINELKDLRSVFLPVMFINETSTITKSEADLIKSKVLAPLTVAHIVELTIIVLGGVFFLTAVVLLVLLIDRNRKLKAIKTIMTPTIPNENSPLLVNT